MKFKVDKNTLTLVSEDEEDLFKLSQIIEKGDIIEGKDQRKVKIGNDTVKKTYYFVIEVENVEEGKPLRVKGRILNEHEDFPKGAYHSFTIDVGKEIKLKKEELSNFILDILKEKKKEPIKAILIDDEKAEFYLIKDKSFEKIKELKYKINEEESYRDYNLVKKELEKLNWDNFIIAGPGVFKEELAKILDKKFTLATVSHLGAQGIKELLKRDELNKFFEDLKTKKEEEIFDKFLVELKKEGNVAYGKDLKELAEIGAIEKLYINSDLIFKEKNPEITDLIKKVEEMKGQVHLIESKEVKNKLKGFGNIIAFLRFKP